MIDDRYKVGGTTQLEAEQSYLLAWEHLLQPLNHTLPHLRIFPPYLFTLPCDQWQVQSWCDYTTGGWTKLPVGLEDNYHNLCTTYTLIYFLQICLPCDMIDNRYKVGRTTQLEAEQSCLLTWRTPITTPAPHTFSSKYISSRSVYLATWLMTGAKLAGPYRFRLDKYVW